MLDDSIVLRSYDSIAERLPGKMEESPSFEDELFQDHSMNFLSDGWITTYTYCFTNLICRLLAVLSTYMPGVSPLQSIFVSVTNIAPSTAILPSRSEI